MAQAINIASKQTGDSLTAGELNSLVAGTNAAITELNETKTTHAAAIANKVDKVTGKGLSTEDYTTAEKQKLAGVAAGATAETGATIKTKLEALTGDARLDASAIKGLPEMSNSAAIYVELTYAQAMAAMIAGTLVPGATYKITDRGDRGLFFTAISTTQFAATGTRLMLCPATYATGVDAHGNNWLGVWHSGLTPAIDDLVIWGGKVWKNLTGNVGTKGASDPYMNNLTSLDEINWGLINKSDFPNHEYTEMTFSVVYDFAADRVFIQCDKKNNIIGYFNDERNTDPNPCDLTDWNNPYIFNNNVGYGIFNNVTSDRISDNIIPEGSIIGNKVDNGIRSNQIYGSGIEDNVCSQILSNSALSISNNNNPDLEIVYNNIFGDISNNGIGIIIIELNNNLGQIANNTAPSDIIAIRNNYNNGDIMGVWSGDVTDVKNDKIGV